MGERLGEEGPFLVTFEDWLKGVESVLEEKYGIGLNDTKEEEEWRRDYENNECPLDAVDSQMNRHDVPTLHEASGSAGWGKPPKYDWDKKIVERPPKSKLVPGEMFKTIEQIEAALKEKGLVLYGSDEAKKLPAGMYIGLFHGFNEETYDHDKSLLDDWGAQGPVIGPLKYAHTTFASHVKLGFTGKNEEYVPVMYQGSMGSMNELEVRKGCLIFDGIAFGDWTVFQK